LAPSFGNGTKVKVKIPSDIKPPLVACPIILRTLAYISIGYNSAPSLKVSKTDMKFKNPALNDYM
jgi:hypothetical protein